MKPVLTPDGQVDLVQTGIKKLREETGAEEVIREMEESAKRARMATPAPTIRHDQPPPVPEAKFSMVIFILGFLAVTAALSVIGHAIRHMVYSSWIEPTEEANLIIFHRSHWFYADEEFGLQSRIDPETTNSVWMKREAVGTNWYPFFNFDEH